MARPNLTRREYLHQLSLSLTGILSAPTLSLLISSHAQPATAQLLGAEDLPKQSPTDKRKMDAWQQQTIQSLSAVIIPKTDTPGAIEAGVPALIESIVREVFAAQERKTFLQGLLYLNQLSQSAYTNAFHALSGEQQQQLASQLNSAAESKQSLSKPLAGGISAAAGESAVKTFAVIKALTIFGFCTSELGATQVLQYQAIPGRFDGCVAMDKGSRAMAE